MLRGMSSALLSEWQAYYELEPWGVEREEVRFAKLCVLIAEPNRDRKRKSTPFTLDDFLPPQFRLGSRAAAPVHNLRAKFAQMATLVNQQHAKRN